MVSLTLKILFKKIANKRRDVALKKMGNQPMLALLFRKETVSYWEDQPIPEKPKQIIPVWRSPAFEICIQKLDQIALSTTNSMSELKSLTLLLERNKEPIQRPQPIFSEIPRRLPADAYDAVRLGSWCCGAWQVLWWFCWDLQPQLWSDMLLWSWWWNVLAMLESWCLQLFHQIDTSKTVWTYSQFWICLVVLWGVCYVVHVVHTWGGM